MLIWFRFHGNAAGPVKAVSGQDVSVASNPLRLISYPGMLWGQNTPAFVNNVV